MARKSKNVERRKQMLISNVPAEQRKIITQPTTFAYLNGEMSVMHARIQAVIMEKLQGKIKKALERKAVEGFVCDLFDNDDYRPISEDDSTPYLTFTVKYSELGVEPSNYKYVSEAARAMQGSLVYEKEVDGYVRSIVAFPVIDVPDETKGERRTDIKLHMTKGTAEDLFVLTRYHRYLKDAVFLFSSGYTGRIYLLINANKYIGTWTIEYEELRKILLTSYDSEKKRWVADKYKDINDFKKRVLEPARKEILEAADRVDCTFDYDFIYPAGKKRGTPEKIVFHIHLTDIGRDMRQIPQESPEKAEVRKILMAFRMRESSANKLIDQMDGRLGILKEKALWLKKFHEEKKVGLHPETPEIKDYAGHAVSSLQNFINEQNAAQQTAAAQPQETAPAQSLAEQMETWD